MFSMRSVTMSFGEAAAVSGVDLEIAPGETTALIGPSGCGKSTLLRLMLGLVEPTGGEVLFDGVPVTVASSPALRQRMGYVIQSGGLFPHLTGGENVALLARHLGWSRARIHERLSELAPVARIEPALLDRYPSEISGGQAQRVALMRALMLDPDVLLLDEPLGALDPIVRAELQEELRDIFERLEKTVVIVTHDLAEAKFLGSAMVLMQHGRVLQAGSFEDIDERPVDPFVSQFVSAQRSRKL